MLKEIFKNHSKKLMFLLFLFILILISVLYFSKKQGTIPSTSSDIYGGYEGFVNATKEIDGHYTELWNDPKNDAKYVRRNYEKEFYCPFENNVSNTECLVKNLDELSAIREWKQIKLENLKYPEINTDVVTNLSGDVDKIKKWRENFEEARDLKCGAEVIFIYGSGSPGAIASCDIKEEISALKILDENYYVTIMSFIGGSKGIPDFEPTEQDIQKLMGSNKTTREGCCGIW
jgi:transcription elongation factor Elf1